VQGRFAVGRSAPPGKIGIRFRPDTTAKTTAAPDFSPAIFTGLQSIRGFSL